MTEFLLRHAETRDDLLDCFPAIHQLRPSLASPAMWQTRAEGMRQDGYRVLTCCDGARVMALAGYRLQSNLVHGRFLFVNDLVTLAEVRGQGLGSRLLRALESIAADAGCERLVLDTALGNDGARRFYRREGLKDVIAGFVKIIGENAA